MKASWWSAHCGSSSHAARDFIFVSMHSIGGHGVPHVRSVAVWPSLTVRRINTFRVFLTWRVTSCRTAWLISGRDVCASSLSGCSFRHDTMTPSCMVITDLAFIPHLSARREMMQESFCSSMRTRISLRAVNVHLCLLSSGLCFFAKL